ncbi:hypothetical protein [Desulfogranum japonicum]|uniref:hypothetical protein n=1 Tax=Desulfogranum japonicum TaxID=231447 RepID=UPI00040F02B0|nr:hypothetical protein [Desulfogranum japonicum]
MVAFTLLFVVTFVAISLFSWLMIYSRGKKSMHGEQHAGCSTGQGCCCGAQLQTQHHIPVQQEIRHE